VTGKSRPGKIARRYVVDKSGAIGRRDLGQRLSHGQGDATVKYRSQRGDTDDETSEAHRARNARGHPGALLWNDRHSDLGRFTIEQACSDPSNHHPTDQWAIRYVPYSQRKREEAEANQRQAGGQKISTGKPVREIMRDDARHDEHWNNHRQHH